jgi:hypothetical protein
VPLTTARELILGCVREAALRADRGEWIAGVIEAILGIDVDHVTVYDDVLRCAEVTIGDRDAAQFRGVFPEAARVPRRSPPDRVVLQIRCAQD